MRDPVAALRLEGVRVRVASGYSTRSAGSSLSAPVGIMLHHTASARNGGDSAALGIVTRGRPASRGVSALPGPLCNLHISRSGVVTVVALGSANHAGKGSGVVLGEVRRGKAVVADARVRGLKDTAYGNSYFIGIEIENDGIGEKWSPAQVDAIIRTCAALSRMYGWSAEHTIHHRQWTSRKIDCSLRIDWTGQIRARLTGKAAPVVKPAGFDPKVHAYPQKGDHGQTIGNVQRALGLKVTYDFDALLDKTLRAFQTKHGLTPDGVIGPKTLEAVRKYGIKPAPVKTKPVVDKVAPPAPKVPSWWTRTLREGSQGNDVKNVQRVVGIPAGAQRDGKFGPATKAAVIAFQKKNGLAPDGEVGPATAAKMIGK